MNEQPDQIKRGKLYLLSGPSGVGKKTIIDVLLKDPDLNLILSVSCTTRPMRPGETNGIEYFFVSKDKFREKISKDQMLEYAEFFDNYYGTSKDYVESQLNLGKNVILEIETIGFRQIKAKIPDIISIFVVPPSFEELERRLRTRGTDSAKSIAMRLEKAKLEMADSYLFTHIVTNDDVNEAISQIKDILLEDINRN